MPFMSNHSEARQESIPTVIAVRFDCVQTSSPLKLTLPAGGLARWLLHKPRPAKPGMAILTEAAGKPYRREPVGLCVLLGSLGRVLVSDALQLFGWPLTVLGFLFEAVNSSPVQSPEACFLCGMVLQQIDLAVDRLDPLVDPIPAISTLWMPPRAAPYLATMIDELVVADLVSAGDLRLVIDQLQDVLRLLIDEPLACSTVFLMMFLSEVH